MTKKCPKCQQVKEISAFGKNRSQSDGLQSYCRPCHQGYVKSWQQRNPQKLREYFKTTIAANPDKYNARYFSEAQRKSCLKGKLKKYGLSMERYSLLLEQGCQLCGETKSLVIDHCHDRETFRGILCSLCNSGLGFFRDDPDLLLKASAYLNA